MRLIDADKMVHYQTYDDEHEEFREYTSTIADFLDTMTDEGCPEIVDAVEVVHGHWIPCHPLGDDTPEGYMCSVCCIGGWEKTDFCPHCGARMDGKDNEQRED